MPKNIFYQFKETVDLATRIGGDKHAAKQSGEAANYIYGFREREGCLSLAHQFKDFLKENYPSVKSISDIKAEHWQHFALDKMRTPVDDKGRLPTAATAKTYESLMHKLQVITETRYHIKLDWDRAHFPRPDREAMQIYRDRPMPRSVYDSVVKQIESKHNSKAAVALKIAGSYGMRVDELARLRVRDVNFERGIVRVEGKGGLVRMLPISDQTKDLWRAACRGKGANDLVVGIKADSINKMFRTALKELGVKEQWHQIKCHGIRKMVAQEVWDKVRAAGGSQQDAMRAVCRWLGHGEMRWDVILRYVGNPW